MYAHNTVQLKTVPHSVEKKLRLESRRFEELSV